MNTINPYELRARIADMEAVVSSSMKELNELKRQLKAYDAAAFISVNKIRRADVELSEEDSKPYFGHITSFIQWLKLNSTKNWAECNTVIYRQSDLKAGRMPEDMVATIHDLKD